jgi:hypothetical protein
MTEVPGNKTPSADPKQAEKSGPVKPPVLEGKARPVGATSSTDKSSGATVETGKPQSGPKTPPPGPKPTEQSRSEQAGTGAPWLAALGGGLLGLAGAYGLAWFGLWPAPPQTPPAADPRIAQVAATLPELQTVTNTVQDELSTLTGRVSSLESAMTDLPTTAPAEETNQLAADLAALADRVDTLTATATSAPVDDAAAAQTASEIESLRQDIAALRQDMNTTSSQLAQAEQQLQGLSDTASANSSAETELARLPLIFSSLESAFATGRPYSAALDALRQAVPNANIPDAIAGHAQAGLPRPDTVASRLHDLIPDILAGRPLGADAGWQDSTMNWFRGVIAMRPAGDLEGEGPEAVVARLELAVASRDFAAARTELEALPPTMQTAATPVAQDIATLADADAFLSALREQALAGEVTE